MALVNGLSSLAYGSTTGAAEMGANLEMEVEILSNAMERYFEKGKEQYS